MLKKCLFAIVVTALLAVTVQGGIEGTEGDCGVFAYKGHPYPWPVEYLKVEICRIPVFWEIGYWVEIKGCDDAEIILVQEDCEDVGRDVDDWPCYKGCAEIAVRTNFDAEMDGDLKHSGHEMSNKERFNGEEPLDIPGDGDWHEVEACVIAYNLELWNESPGGVKEEIGYLKVRIKPQADP